MSVFLYKYSTLGQKFEYFHYFQMMDLEIQKVIYFMGVTWIQNYFYPSIVVQCSRWRFPHFHTIMGAFSVALFVSFVRYEYINIRVGLWALLSLPNSDLLVRAVIIKLTRETVQEYKQEQGLGLLGRLDKQKKHLCLIDTGQNS